MRVEKKFDTKQEAAAFKAGVEYVADPAVRIAGVEPAGPGLAFRVLIDDDSVVSQDDPPDADEYPDDEPPYEDDVAGGTPD